MWKLYTFLVFMSMNVTLFVLGAFRSYGSVYKALHKESGQVLAIKQVPLLSIPLELKRSNWTHGLICNGLLISGRVDLMLLFRFLWILICRKSSKRSPLCNNVIVPSSSSIMAAISKTQICGWASSLCGSCFLATACFSLVPFAQNIHAQHEGWIFQCTGMYTW